MILDTCILVAWDRRGKKIAEMLDNLRGLQGESKVALSAVSIVELTHGIYRGSSLAARDRRRDFAEDLMQSLTVFPVTVEIAQLAGRIEGEQAALGFAIPFEDLIIGTTALYYGFDIATPNVRHFKLIPDLKIVAL